MTPSDRQVAAALVTLIILQLIMLSALYAGIEPHPPVATPLFGIAPFIGASVALAAAACLTQPLRTRAGSSLALLAAATALVSFGPQKYLDAQIGLIWPAVVLGQAAAGVIVLRLIGAQRSNLLSTARTTAQARRT